ncbi:hypothetical protein [Streptomyces sp. NBC_01006]|uniref:hypothetical protein n=1 Tax=Streptomyces sp. NBC_01006 TaxID=2903716 RepID=UPI003867EB33|nr:hypothetical protein OG509_16340 [Streptomyces sp. NBC_01006]
MTAGRGDRAAPPAPLGQWEVRFADAASAKGWESLTQQACENTYRAWILMRTDPMPLAEQTCEQWQIEVTGGGRIWYLVDMARDTCWITVAGTGHPRATDSR